MNPFRVIVLFVTLALMVGCVSQPVEEKESPLRLVIAQNSDGDVTLAWESEPGSVYTIYYQQTADADWVPLKSATRVSGTGETLTASHHVNPHRPQGRYRILPEKK